MSNNELEGAALLCSMEKRIAELEQQRGELMAASERLVRHHLDASEVHPCDDGNDDIRAGQCITEARDLYLIIKQLKGCAA